MTSTWNQVKIQVQPQRHCCIEYPYTRQMPFERIRNTEVERTVKKRAKKRTAPGPSGMSDQGVSTVCAKLGYEVTNLLNMLQIGRIPPELTRSTIRLLFKVPTEKNERIPVAYETGGQFNFRKFSGKSWFPSLIDCIKVLRHINTKRVTQCQNRRVH